MDEKASHHQSKGKQKMPSHNIQWRVSGSWLWWDEWAKHRLGDRQRSPQYRKNQLCRWLSPLSLRSTMWRGMLSQNIIDTNDTLPLTVKYYNNIGIWNPSKKLELTLVCQKSISSSTFKLFLPQKCFKNYF